MERRGTREGFTLIEMAVVLVIIGLIVGGVLVGRDLVRSSEIRATVSQIQKYNSAVNTFRGKYGGLPANCDYSQMGVPQHYIGQCKGVVGTPGVGTAFNEANAKDGFEFFYQLSAVGLVEGGFTQVQGAWGTSMSSTTAPKLFPATKMSSTALIVPTVFTNISLLQGNIAVTGYVSSYTNGYYIATVSDASLPFFSVAFSPSIAQLLDGKIDDGLPLTGSVVMGAQEIDAKACSGNGVVCQYSFGVCSTGWQSSSTYRNSSTLGCTLAFLNQF